MPLLVHVPEKDRLAPNVGTIRYGAMVTSPLNWSVLTLVRLIVCAFTSPLKVAIEFIESWLSFIRDKKEEI